MPRSKSHAEVDPAAPAVTEVDPPAADVALDVAPPAPEELTLYSVIINGKDMAVYAKDQEDLAAKVAKIKETFPA